MNRAERRRLEKQNKVKVKAEPTFNMKASEIGRAATTEGGHLEGQRVLPGAFALYRGGRTQSTQKSWLQKSECHLSQLELSASFGPDDPGMFLCGDVAQDRGVKRHIRRLARTWRPEALGDGFRHQFLY